MIQNRKVTLAEIDALSPCNPAAYFLGEAWSGTLLDILKHGKVSDVNKIWVVTKLMDEKHARLFAVYCAREAIKNVVGEVDPRTLAAIDVAEKFVNGNATWDELSAARSAAQSAVESAFESAAGSAAQSATECAAYSAAFWATSTTTLPTHAAYFAFQSATECAAYSASAWCAAPLHAFAAPSHCAAGFEFVQQVIKMIIPNVDLTLEATTADKDELVTALALIAGSTNYTDAANRIAKTALKNHAKVTK